MAFSLRRRVLLSLALSGLLGGFVAQKALQVAERAAQLHPRLVVRAVGVDRRGNAVHLGHVPGDLRAQEAGDQDLCKRLLDEKERLRDEQKEREG